MVEYNKVVHSILHPGLGNPNHWLFGVMEMNYSVGFSNSKVAVVGEQSAVPANTAHCLKCTAIV